MSAEYKKIAHSYLELVQNCKNAIQNSKTNIDSGKTTPEKVCENLFDEIKKLVKTPLFDP